MGRRIPADEATSLLMLHPVLQLSFFVAGMVATIAIITALCGFRRKPPPSSDDDPPDAMKTTTAEDQSDVVNTTTTTTAAQEDTQTTENEETADNKELPLPPGKKQLGQTESCDQNKPAQMRKSASERRLLSNLSIKLPRTLSVAMNREKIKEEYNKRKNGKMMMMKKQEDSIWMKTIILGEKCVPDEDQEAVIYEAKGKKIPAYHPKSRQSSFIDPTTIPDHRRKALDHIDDSNNKNDEQEQQKDPQ